MVYFSADDHYGHSNILRYCSRPFATIEEHDEALITNWNRVVKPQDTAYIIGDLAFYKDQNKTAEVVRRLNGKKHLVLGNHDKFLKPFVLEMFASVNHYLEIKVQDSEAYKGSQLIVLLHYAMKVWNRSHSGSWHLYGHSHSSLADDPNSLSFDVGVDAHNYTPISYDQVKAIMKNKTFKPIDHHNRK